MTNEDICPRCGRNVQERFHGPCESCRAELRAAVVTVAPAGGDETEAGETRLKQGQERAAGA